MGEPITAAKPRSYYDCVKCPAFCCSVYERVQVTKRDIRRLAKHFGVTEDGMTGQWEKLVVRNGIHAPRPGNGYNGSREERQPAAPHGDENLWASIINDAERQTNQHR